MKSRYILFVSFVILFAFDSYSQKNIAQINTISASPYIPQYVEWGGEKIMLDRYDMRERFDREMISFCYGHINTLMIIKRANRYFPIIKPIIEEMGLPADFIYLAAIESSLNPRAQSPAKAVGLWQIMPATAKEYGLEVNDNVDERYNIIKSTRAACEYLKKAYEKYGSWITAAASYNAGHNRISTEMTRQLQNHAFDLWLNIETSRYMFRLMAIKMIMENPVYYGFAIRSSQLYPSIRFKEIEVTNTISDLPRFAIDNGISFSQLKEFNLWLRSQKLPVQEGNSYMILIPYIDDLFYSTNSQEVYDKRWVID
ncbi:MAG: lytic transglycosylase domain-containing protein [Bacteroidales bacterium]|nr:lytic transglycosylase domain-containing protein [Bacteroidales bacterium]